MNFSCYKNKKVLVTGHTGFKGSWLCEWLLALGAEVYGFSNGIPTRPALFTQLRLAKRIKMDIRGDIRDRALVRKVVMRIKPDFVFHLAAQPLVRLSYEQPVETFDTNVMGTVNVLDALRCLQDESKSKVEVEEKSKLRVEVEQRENSSVRLGLGTSTSPSAVRLGLGTSTSPSAKSWRCSAIMITTDKCYENKETTRPYKETDPMGGYDPYSCSKGCDELVVSSYRRSFFNSPDSSVWIASARAGNVIGGGDWARDRIVPDAMRAWLGVKSKSQVEVEEMKYSAVRLGLAPSTLIIRNSKSTRPWQHVLEPLSGYLTLGAALDARKNFASVASGFNFGPNPNANRTVKEVVEELLKHTKGKWVDKSDPHAVHEAELLNLNIRKAAKILGWKPTWNFAQTLEKVAEWYVGVTNGEKPLALTQKQIADFVGAGKT